MSESDNNFINEGTNDSETYDYGDAKYTLNTTNTSRESYVEIENLEKYEYKVNGKLTEQGDNCKKKTKDSYGMKLTKNNSRNIWKNRKEKQNKKSIKEKGCNGILVKDIDDLFCTILQKEQNQKKTEKERKQKEKYKEITNTKSYVSSTENKIHVEQRKRKGERGKNRKHENVNKQDSSESSDKKRRYSAMEYKVLCKTQKMSVIDMMEDPVIEKELVDIVKKVHLKVHWDDNIEYNPKDKKKTSDTIKNNKGSENDKINKHGTNEAKKGILKNAIIKKKSIKNIIKHSKKEYEFDAAIDLLKSYYGLKETDIYYISEDRKSLIRGSVLVCHKVINIKLSDNKNVKINIDSIRKIDDYIDNKEYPNIKNINDLNLIVIIYEPKPQKMSSFVIFFKDQLKLFLFLSLLKSYHRISFNKISEDILELVAKYNQGVDVKKISKRGNISDVKILVADSVIRFFSITKMKGKIFDIIEDFISYDTNTNSPFFDLLSEDEKNEIDPETYVVLHFTYFSIPLIFPSPDDKENFIVLLLFLRRHN